MLLRAIAKIEVERNRVIGFAEGQIRSDKLMQRRLTQRYVRVCVVNETCLLCLLHFQIISTK